MPKKSFQDILKVKKNDHTEIIPVEEKSRHTLWFIAVFSIFFLFFAISFVFSSAKVTVIPKEKQIPISQDFSANKDSNTDNDLPYDLMILSGDVSKPVQTGEEKDYATNAKGKIVLYNVYNFSPQIFSINTRLESANGKIYKTDSAVTVPGASADGTPGSIEVDISANEAGAEYNSGPTDFKIMSFKGTPKYSKFYGRSKGDLQGGLKGKSRQISDSDLSNAVTELSVSLQSKLYDKAINQIPKGYILYKDAVFLNVDSQSVDPATADGMAALHLNGTLYGFVLNKDKLTKKIVQSSIPAYDGSEVYIPNINDLKFSLNNKENISFTDVTNISFNLSGTPKIIWKFDSEKLRNDLMGKSKKEFNQILSQYPNIDTADLVIKPIWKSSFPDKSKDINIVVNYPN